MKTKNLTIIPFEESDLFHVKQWFHSDDYKEYFRDIQELSEAQLKLYTYNGNGQHFIVRKGVDPIGFASLYDWKIIPATIKFSILIDKEYQKQGYAFEVCFELIKYAFYKLNVNKIIFEVLKSNSRNIECLEKFGCKCEGVYENETKIDGIYQDTLKYVLYQNDFRKAEVSLCQIIH